MSNAEPSIHRSKVVIASGREAHPPYAQRDEAHFILDIIGEDVQRDIIQDSLDLLTYSRVGSKGHAIEEVDMNRVLQTATTNLAAAIEAERAVVTSEPLPTVWADGQEMLQLMQNLVANGVKFHGPDPPEVCISAVRRDGFHVLSVATTA